MKVLTVVGARPQFIKAAPVSRVLRQKVKEILVHTGQHYDQSMSEVFFEELQIPVPDYHLHVGSQSPGAQTGAMLNKLEEVLLKEKPDAVLVYGDTNSTLAGSLAAAKLHIPVAHVEAGLRSFNKNMPEEINRVLTDHVSTWLFCPTNAAIENLRAEGIVNGVYRTGDVMLDTFLFNQKLASEKSTILKEYELEAGTYLLTTVHRAENTDDPQRLRNIVSVMNRLEVPTVFPVHPRTKKKMQEQGLVIENPKVKVLPPVSFLDMIQLEVHAYKILTDSGGVQKEAFFAKVPCITLRDETEWVETVEHGANCLVGTDLDKIMEAVQSFTVDFSQLPSIYGNGQAAEEMAGYLLEQKGSE